MEIIVALQAIALSCQTSLSVRVVRPAYLWDTRGVGKSEGTRRAKRGGHPIVRGDGSKVPGVEVVQLTNKKVNFIRG